jgi:cellulose biosynthesis protein BcsQ
MPNVLLHGNSVPIVAFYSVQGGVGKSTLARKFAELVTLAPGRDGRKPNVLVVDLDVDTQGITFRFTGGQREGVKTVHEVIAEQSPTFAQALNVTMAVELASGNPQARGQLYLMPAAPPEAKGIFDTGAKTDRSQLFRLLQSMIQTLVTKYDISCVVIDCPPHANPYSAAAAALSDVPLLIGRNEQTTYEQLRVLPERFREMFPEFQLAKQRVIINAVTVKEIYEKRAQQYGILDYIPMVSDVIHETEGLRRIGSFRLLLFEKFVVDIIKKVLVGENHLIPDAPSIVGEEWAEAIAKLDRCQDAPKVRRLKVAAFARWVGLGLLILGSASVAVAKLWSKVSDPARSSMIPCIIAGLALMAGGWFASSERNRLLATARNLVIGGPDEVLRMLKEGVTHRRHLEEMKKLADSVPDLPRP